MVSDTTASSDGAQGGLVIPPVSVDAGDGGHVSVLLERLLAAGLPTPVSVGWLVERLGSRPLAAALFILGIAGMFPMVSLAIGILVIPLAGQLLRGRTDIRLPKRLAARSFPADRVAGTMCSTASVLRRLENVVRPRWRAAFLPTRAIGAVVLLLGLSLLIPIPLSNILPGAAIAMIALAYLERDGLLLALSLAGSVGALGFAAAAAWRLIAAL